MHQRKSKKILIYFFLLLLVCLLYTSDAADDSLRVDLGGRHIIKKLYLSIRKSKVKKEYKINSNLKYAKEFKNALNDDFNT